MTGQAKPLEELVKELSPEHKKEVRDLVECLLQKSERKSNRTLKLDWRGALEDLKNKYTSVELQHKILHLWGS